MKKSYARIVCALGAAAAVTTSALVTAAPAGAVERGIAKPTMRVVCGETHHGPYFTAIRFRQHGRWAAGGAVVVKVASGNSNHVRAEMHTRTRADGTFRLHRTLYSNDAGPWIRGATYTWTTAIYGKTWAVARRGTVTLTGSC
jgi:hypothetical protein